MKKPAILIILFVLAVFSLQAQENVKFEAKAKSVVEAGENFYLQYEMNKKGKNLNLPDMSPFRVLSGPSQQTSSSTHIINGEVSHSYTFRHTYMVKAPETGTYEIPPASVNIAGKKYSSNKLTINVVESANRQTQRGTNTGRQPARSSSSQGEKPFARVHVNKTTAYQGEPIYARLKLYLPDRNLAGFRDISFPEFNGFWSEDFNMPDQIQLTTENYSGKNYWVAELASWILYPQQSGKLTIEGGQYDVVMRERVSGGQSRSVFDSFFGHYENVEKTLTSPPVNFNIKALPSGKPSGFTGGVGGFRVSSEISHDSIDVNDAFSIRIRISGTGNLNLLNKPELELPDVFEMYAPEVESNYKQTINGSQGNIEYVYTIIPRYPDDYTLPGVKAAWFDPSAGRYKTYQSENFRIHVRRTKDYDESDALQKTDKGSKTDIISTDIRFLKDITSPKQPVMIVFNTKAFWLFYIVPFLVLIIIIVLRRKQIKERANITKQRNKKANKIAMRRLKKAKSLMQNEDKAFYNETIKALWGYVADKLDMETSMLSRENVSEALQGKNIPEPLIKDMLVIIDECEYAHFAPAANDTEKQRIYSDAVSLITKLEQNL
ncbi:MAG: BatD family protein [Bacteroidota bacterium]|nr:BatD family protein [Bacteroidota bacterium]